MNTRTAPKRAQIDLKPVKSSAIPAIGYDSRSKTLRIRFASGYEYELDNASEEDHKGLVSAKSAGRHFQQHLAGKEWRRVA